MVPLLVWYICWLSIYGVSLSYAVSPCHPTRALLCYRASDRVGCDAATARYGVNARHVVIGCYAADACHAASTCDVVIARYALVSAVLQVLGIPSNFVIL